MARAQGARAQMALAFETTYGTPPVGGFTKMPFASTSLGAEQPLLNSELLGYLINSPMLPDLVTEADGSTSIYLSATKPEGDKAKNWLPAPKGPFMAVLRVYYPEASVLDGTWKQPEVQLAS